MAKQEKKQKSKKPLIIALWLLGLGPLLAIWMMVLAASWGWFGKLPTFEELENPDTYLASEIISADNKIIGTYFLENRSPVRYEDLSSNLVKALVATEDERFFDHAGIDIKSLPRVVKGVVTGDLSKGGGSTITQQLAKMLFNNPPKSKIERVLQKFKEWVIAVRLEKQYTKEEIIAMYLNKVDFLNLAVGIKSASRIYFDTTPEELQLEQAAMLVGMVKNPRLYNPLRRDSLTWVRRNVVFRQMVRNEYITEEERDSLKGLPLSLNFQRTGHNEGLAPYFREHIRQTFMPKWLAENKKQDGSSYNLYTDGLKIYTTINSKMQSYAERAVRRHIGELQEVFFEHWEGRKLAPFSDLNSKEVNDLMMQAMRRSERYRKMSRNGAPMDSIKQAFNKPVPMKVFSYTGEIDTVLTPMDSIWYYKFFLRAGLMSMDPRTGFVNAWVGGIDHEHFKFDHVIDGKRQVGSTFKPFVYATAVDHGYSPCYEVENVQVSFDKDVWGLSEDWMPKSSSGKYGGIYTLKQGLAQSVNTITAFLMKQVGPKNVKEMAVQLGLDPENIPAVPSICLGTPDVSVFEMVRAYSAFANKGFLNEPVTVTRIEDKNGVVLYEYVPNSKEVLSEQTAYVMLDILRGVNEPGGSGYRLRYTYGFDNPIAGKTGTTQNNSDGWYMGIVPQLVCGVWVGCEDRSAHFRSTRLGQGANMALPVFAHYLGHLYKDRSLGYKMDLDFARPAEGLKVELDCSKFKRRNRQLGNNLPEF